MADNNNSNLFSVPEVNEIKRLAGGSSNLDISDTITVTQGLVTITLTTLTLEDTWYIGNINIQSPITIPSNAIDVYAYVTLTYSEDNTTKTLVLFSPCTILNNQVTSTLGRHLIPKFTYNIVGGGLRYRTIS